MKQETQQKIVSALNRLYDDLADWLREQGLSETKAVAFFEAAMREDGLLATSIISRVGDLLPLKPLLTLEAAQVEQALVRFKSGEFASWLLNQPEPTAEELEVLLVIKEALPNLRQLFLNAAETGPHHQRGGRPIEISDPAEREKIRQTIMSLRGPGVTLQDIYQRLAKKYGVSATTIKRIRAEKNRPRTT